VLVPATMTLLGQTNWWLPKWLDRTLPRGPVGTDGTEGTDGTDTESTGEVPRPRLLDR
jgi:RND superfamily putative drug exporter